MSSIYEIITVHRGNLHNYFGMGLDLHKSNNGKCFHANISIQCAAGAPVESGRNIMHPVYLPPIQGT